MQKVKPEENQRLSQVKDTCIDFSPVLAYPAPLIKGSFVPSLGEERYERISRFIPYPRRHRRHYHRVFALNSPLRQKVAASAQKRSKSSIPSDVQESAEKVEKASEGGVFGYKKCFSEIVNFLVGTHPIDRFAPFVSFSNG